MHRTTHGAGLIDRLVAIAFTFAFALALYFDGSRGSGRGSDNYCRPERNIVGNLALAGGLRRNN